MYRVSFQGPFANLDVQHDDIKTYHDPRNDRIRDILHTRRSDHFLRLVRNTCQADISNVSASNQSTWQLTRILSLSQHLGLVPEQCRFLFPKGLQWQPILQTSRNRCHRLLMQSRHLRWIPYRDSSLLLMS